MGRKLKEKLKKITKKKFLEAWSPKHRPKRQRLRHERGAFEVYSWEKGSTDFGRAAVVRLALKGIGEGIRMGLKQRAAVSICIDMDESKNLKPGRFNPHTEAHVNHLSADSPRLTCHRQPTACWERTGCAGRYVDYVCLHTTLCARFAEGPGAKEQEEPPPWALPQGSKAAAFLGHLKELSNCKVGEGGLGKSRSFPIKEF